VTRVAVVGGGVIGLSAAWRLASSGCGVELFDDRPGQGASHAAAGMLAPVSETGYGEDELLAAGLDSVAAWPDFAARLEAASGVAVGFRPSGSLLVGHDPDDARALRRHAELLARHDLPVELLTSRQARALEPALSPRTTSALLVPGDHSVDNRALVRALRVAAERAGVRERPFRVAVDLADGRVAGVRGPDGQRYPADVVVVAAGAGSVDVPGLPAACVPAVRPIKGQILRLTGAAGLLTRTVRALVAGVAVYLVPRESGEVVVGATTEDVGLDGRVTAGAVHDLLRAAIAVVPEVAELELAETLARFRPGTPDNAPLIGHGGVDGLLLATGHYRGGVLLAPVTADALVALVHGREVPAAVRPLAPRRFASVGGPAVASVPT
jgi:glycine oxidase